MSIHRKTRELTGKHVLLCLLGFFGVVFAVNAVMVKAATSTFGGVETSSSYKAGLMFEREVARAEQQDELHWQVGGKIARNKAGAQGGPLAGITAQARLAHPADERLDHVIVLDRTNAGLFHGEALAQAGQWELIVDLYRGETRIFRSRSRVTLR
jgi:nitrogen fixation protein FixH